MVAPVRPNRGGFLRPFGCGLFIRDFLLGNGPQGSDRIDPDVGAPQVDIRAAYKEALYHAFAKDQAEWDISDRTLRGETVTEEQARQIQEYYFSRIPYKITKCRYHSFMTYCGVLKRLGWIEPTGQVEMSAFQQSYPPGPPRVFYRLTDAGKQAPLTAWSNPHFTLYRYPVEETRAKRRAKKYYRPRQRRAAPVTPPTPPPTAAAPKRPRRAAAPPAPPPPPPAAPPTPAPPTALGPPETAPREIKEIWERSLAEVKRDYPIGHPSLKAEAGRAGVSQEETQKIIAHGIYIERRRKVLERWAEEEAKAPPAPPPAPPPVAAPAMPPTAIPAFTVAPKPSRGAAQRLIAHLLKVEKMGLDSPEVKAELARLGGEVSEWESLVGEAADKEEEKDEPDEDRLDTLQDRLEALERAAEQLEAGDVEGAVGTLDDAWPKPASAG